MLQQPVTDVSIHFHQEKNNKCVTASSPVRETICLSRA